MGKTSYQNLQKIVREIDAKIVQLKDGNLSLTELEDLVKMSADLHERLAVLRYKAYEKFGEPIKASVEIEATGASSETPEAKPFDLTFTSEISAPDVTEKVEEPSHELDFSAPVFSKPKDEYKEIPIVEPEVKKPIHVIREEVKPDATSLHEKFLKDEDIDLNDILKKEEELPLRKKLGLTPIKDLRTEIGIGKKFEYINFLFAGDAKAYETAINELNNCSGAEAAKQKLNVYASVYKWDLEEKTIIKFVELVERRFL